jgi:GT2 family glycosyltransferase
MVRDLATVAVVPRERFSLTRRSLETLLDNTEPGVELIYIDGGSPPEVRDFLERRSAEREFSLIRTNDYLAPNVARNMALAHVRTKYVVFVDNDAIVSPGWLAPLVDCAEATGAWVVGPVYCEREPIATRIHMAGGEARIEVVNGRRVLHEEHCHYGKSLEELRPILHRRPVETIEFHCALVRMDAFERLGPLDERLLSASEHTDLCLATRAAGGEVYMEPKSVVTYLPPPPFEPTDLPYFRLRWSHAWNEISIERFREKWDLPADDPSLVPLRNWLTSHRQLTLAPYRKVLRAFGRTPARIFERTLVGPLEQAANRIRFPIRRYAPDAALRRAA